MIRSPAPQTASLLEQQRTYKDDVVLFMELAIVVVLVLVLGLWLTRAARDERRAKAVACPSIAYDSHGTASSWKKVDFRSMKMWQILSIPEAMRFRVWDLRRRAPDSWELRETVESYEFELSRLQARADVEQGGMGFAKQLLQELVAAPPSWSIIEEWGGLEPRYQEFLLELAGC